MKNLDQRLASAVRHFWTTRARQGQRQGRATGQRDYGNRTVATGGRQLDGFSALVRELLVESGIPGEIIFDTGRDNVTLPGFFRPTKQWDVVVVVEGQLLAAIEFKALCGPSFGNNYNNRVEEALGSATDIWTAYLMARSDNHPSRSSDTYCSWKSTRSRCEKSVCLRSTFRCSTIFAGRRMHCAASIRCADS